VAHRSLQSIVARAEKHGLMSSEHFSIDGTRIQAWASMKPFRPKTKEATATAGGVGRRRGGVSPMRRAWPPRSRRGRAALGGRARSPDRAPTARVGGRTSTARVARREPGPPPCRASRRSPGVRAAAPRPLRKRSPRPTRARPQRAVRRGSRGHRQPRSESPKRAADVVTAREV
jgi:hypothetical protein